MRSPGTSLSPPSSSPDLAILCSLPMRAGVISRSAAVARFVPSSAQIVLTARIAEHVVVTLDSLASGDIETDIQTSIALIQLAKEGLIRYSMGDQLVRCTQLGRLWVHGHENWHAGERRRVGS